MSKENQPIVLVEGLRKTFGEQTALAGIDFQVDAGEVHAVVGENGSGKSTLIKCLTGVYTPDRGSRITWPAGDGTAHPRVATVHQDLGLIPDLSVQENICLGTGYSTSFGKIRWRQDRKRAGRLLDELSAEIDPRQTVGELPLADRAAVALARALSVAESGGSLLILDEPTAALPLQDRERLLKTVTRLSGSGIGVIYISHRLDEVTEIGDRVTVLRDGTVVATESARETTERRLVELMTGTVIEDVETIAGTRPERRESGDPILSVDDISGELIRDAGFQVGRGEVLGLTGIAGSGAAELCEIIAGARPARSGSISVEGARLPSGRPEQAVRHGVGFVPADRRREGGVPSLTVRENLSLLACSDRPPLVRVSRGQEREQALEVMDTLDVRPRNPDHPFGLLSGGNQQKVVIGRWLLSDTKILVLDEPTQGVDPAAREEIHSLIRELAAKGTAVVVTSVDVDEVLKLSDRLLVIRDGRIVTEVSRPDETSAGNVHLWTQGSEDAPALDENQRTRPEVGREQNG